GCFDDDFGVVGEVHDVTRTRSEDLHRDDHSAHRCHDVADRVDRDAFHGHPLPAMSLNTTSSVSSGSPKRAMYAPRSSPASPVSRPSPYTSAGWPVLRLMMMNAMSSSSWMGGG